jgi:hypothetical protein
MATLARELAAAASAENTNAPQTRAVRLASPSTGCRGALVQEERRFHRSRVGRELQNCDGWVKVKTKDRAPQLPPRRSPPPTTFVVDDRMAGTTLSFLRQTRIRRHASDDRRFRRRQRRHLRDTGSTTRTGTGTPPAADGCRECERTGESIREHANRFKAMADTMRDLFPPNVPETP